MEFRGLATDEAQNNNALQTTWAQYTSDNLPPSGFDWNDDTVTNQIEVGTTVHFEISIQDALMNDNTRTGRASGRSAVPRRRFAHLDDLGLGAPEGSRSTPATRCGSPGSHGRPRTSWCTTRPSSTRS
ncbi:MAG: hypothetical protein MZV65_29000 [Chromatiales bacterium]|nr:hypothetical protein [Chromatiales bacterium]